MDSIPTYLNPKLQDEIVQQLNVLLAGEVERLYGIVHIGYDEEGKTYPSIYRNDGSKKNMILFPDNRVKSFGFWEFSEATVLDDDEGIEYELSFVFWGNLQRIDESKDYDFTSEIEQSIVQILKDDGATGITYTQEDVFSDYSKYEEKSRQTLMRPNTGFKISFRKHSFIC